MVESQLRQAFGICHLINPCYKTMREFIIIFILQLRKLRVNEVREFSGSATTKE